MLISYKWLKELVPTKHTPEKVAEILTLGGFEVETIEQPGKPLEKLVVGEIKKISQHSDADSLVVTTVSTGKKELHQIVCGAKNISVGDKVPVALPGTTLPNGMTIEKRKIRDVESGGMLCAEDELGLGDDHGGILLLDKKATLGQKVSTALGLNDTVFDVTVSPQRAEAQSMIGLAREYAALANLSFKEPSVSVPEQKKSPITKKLTVQVDDDHLCPKYTARYITGVQIGPSPHWLQSRLRLAGHTPINNIVDVTNYVLLEYGQPLHAFDAHKVHGKKIIVKKSGKKQSFVTLDDEERELASDMLMINDSKGPIAIAGVIGGQHSAIGEDTTDIILESAIFKPLSVRTTRQKLGITTDASQRFERGIWWELPEQAIDRAAQLIHDVAGGTVAAGMLNTAPEKKKEKNITISIEYINDVMGTHLSFTTINRYLQRLSFGVDKKDEDTLVLTVPAWRTDLSIPADIVEEIGRLYGWNKLSAQPIEAEISPTDRQSSFHWQQKIKHILSAAGMTEVYNYSLYGENLFSQFGWTAAEHYRISNPMNKEQEYLRVSLVPGLYVNVLKTYQQREVLRVFEIGRVFYKTKKNMPDEHTMVAGMLYDRTRKIGDQQPIRQLQGIVRALTRHLGIAFTGVSFSVNSDDAQVIDIEIGGTVVGWYGWLIQHEGKLSRPPVWFEIDMDALVAQAEPVRQFQHIPAYPTVERDMTFTMPVDTSFFSARDAMLKINPLISAVEAVDLYGIDDDVRSATFHIVYQSDERTLHSDEVNAIEKKIISLMENKFNARLKR